MDIENLFDNFTSSHMCKLQHTKNIIYTILIIHLNFNMNDVLQLFKI